MPQDENQEVVLAKAALPPPPSPQVKPPGSLRATLALVLSVAALGFSIYGLAARVTEEKLPPLPVAPPDMAGIASLEERMQKQEARQGQFAEDMAKVTAHFDEKTKDIPTPEQAPAEDVKGRLNNIQQGNDALQAEIRASFLRKTHEMTAFSLVQSARQKLRDGIDFSREVKSLGEDIPVAELQPLQGIANPAPLADRSLREDLHKVAPGFEGLEKMGQAGGFFQKLAARAETLVTVRPKDGMPVNENPSGKSLATLEDALNAHAWPVALTAAETLQAKAPPEFAPWHLRLTQRIEAEKVLDHAEAKLLASLRDEPAAAPAPVPAQEAAP